MEQFYYYLPAIKIVVAAIVTSIGIIVKLITQQKMLKTKKVVYMNHTPGQEIGIRILFYVSSIFTILVGIEGIKTFGNWYFYLFLILGITYFFVSVRDLDIAKKLKKK